MSLHHDLLEQARHLLAREPRKPKQASLRRAVSAAYYALFHLILDEGAKQFTVDADLRLLVRRAFVHGEMKKAAKTLSSGGVLPAHVANIYGGTIPIELRRIAAAFVILQDARHDADYNLGEVFNRADVRAYVDLSETSFADWTAVKARPADRAAVELFLASMLLWDRWGK